MNKIVNMSEIRNFDVIVATSSFDYDPFEEEKSQSTMNNGSRRLLSNNTTSTIKVSILGLPGIGKSALALRYSKSDFLSYYEPTIEEEFEKRVTVQGIDIDVSILDTAGQEAFQALRSNWIVGRDAFILGFDATKPNLTELYE